MAFSIKALPMTLKCINTNEGGARICNPDRAIYYPDDLIIVDGDPKEHNVNGKDVSYHNSNLRSRREKITISFAGVKSNDLIGTLKRGHLEVLPKIGLTVSTIGNIQIPDSYREIPMTGLYVDTNKVDVQVSRLVELDGVVHTKVISLFHVPKVETIHNGVCRLCHQKTNHPRKECPSGDLCMEPYKNCGSFTVMPKERKPLCKDNGLRFYRIPDGANAEEALAKFSEYGEVKSLHIMSGSSGVGSSGVVKYLNINDAERALNALKDEFRMYWLV